MPSFSPGPNLRTPFGKKYYLRSTTGVKYDHGTVASSVIPTVAVDGVDTKVLYPGTVMARITSGADTGKLGPRDADATDGRQTVANIVGINDTFLPNQLLNRDVEIAFAYDASVVTAWCREYDGSATAYVEVTSTSIAAMDQTATTNFTFH